MEIYFCEKCGNVMQEKDRFCPKCGAERMMDGAEMKIVLPYGVAKLTVEFAEKLKPARKPTRVVIVTKIPYSKA